MAKKEKEDERSLYQNLTGSSKVMGHIVQGGLAATVLGLLVRYFLYTYKFQNIKDPAGKIFDGIADFFGLFAFLGFGILILGLLSIALVGKDVHLYLRIGILVGVAIILGRFLTFGFFF
ncbi:MAG: hypothetical protein ACMUFK_00695 [Thermoplasmatota archaeon]